MHSEISQHITSAENSLQEALRLIQKQFETQIAAVRELPVRAGWEAQPNNAAGSPRRRPGRPRKAAGQATATSQESPELDAADRM